MFSKVGVETEDRFNLEFNSMMRILWKVVTSELPKALLTWLLSAASWMVKKEMEVGLHHT